jgi:hypothetical protein
MQKTPAKSPKRVSDIEKFQPKLGNPINNKLGPGIHTWSITAGSSCPGKTVACAGCCYAMRGFFNMPAVERRMQANYDFSRSKEFVPWMTKAIWAHSVRVLRVHVAGDFYDAAYVQKWIDIAKQTPRVVYYGYTRSWRTLKISESLERLALVKNFRLWYSADVDTGIPPKSPGLRGIAWLARDKDEEDATPCWADLVFRDKPDALLKKAGETRVQVCPNELGLPAPYQRLTCTQCQICFRTQKDPDGHYGK